MTARGRLAPILDALERFYGALPMPPRDAFGVYVWKVLSVQTTPQRREATLGALRQIPALTPDSLARAPRAKLQGAVAHAGPLRDERLRALTAGAAAFRRHADLPRTLRQDLPVARAALALLPHLGTADGEWLLLFAGGHAILPSDPSALRVLSRLDDRDAAGRDPEKPAPESAWTDAAREVGHDLARLRRAITYLSHHGLTTCTEGDPHCAVCPLLDGCAEGTARQRGSIS
jgi:endonuclease III